MSTLLGPFRKQFPKQEASENHPGFGFLHTSLLAEFGTMFFPFLFVLGPPPVELRGYTRLCSRSLAEQTPPPPPVSGTHFLFPFQYVLKDRVRDSKVHLLSSRPRA